MTFRLESRLHNLFLEPVHPMFIFQTSFSRLGALIGGGRLSEKWRSLKKETVLQGKGLLARMCFMERDH